MDDRPDLDNKVVNVAVAEGRDPREALREFDVQLASMKRARSNPADALWVNVACRLAKWALEDVQQIYLGSFDSGPDMIPVHYVQERFISLAAIIREGLTVLDRCEKTIPRPVSHAVMFCGRSDSTAIKRALRWADDFLGMVSLCLQGHQGEDAKQAYYSGAYSVGPEFPISDRWSTEVSSGKETSDARDVIRLVARCSNAALKEIAKLPFPDEEGPDGFDNLKAKMDSEVASAQQRRAEDQEDRERRQASGLKSGATPELLAEAGKPAASKEAAELAIAGEIGGAAGGARPGDYFLFRDKSAGTWKCYGTPLQWRKPGDEKCFEILMENPNKWVTKRQLHQACDLAESTINSTITRIRAALWAALKRDPHSLNMSDAKGRSRIRRDILQNDKAQNLVRYRLCVQASGAGFQVANLRAMA